MTKTVSMPLAARLADFACTAKATEVPSEARRAAAACLANFLGSALVKTGLPWAEHGVRTAQSESGRHTIIGHSSLAPASLAAYANSVLGASTALVDTIPSSAVHAGLVVLPVLLAASETCDASGEDLEAAAVVGYEIAGALGDALFGGQRTVRFRPTSVVGPLAAAAAASRLLQLNRDQTTHAIALAANTSAGLMEWAKAGTTELVFQGGFAAQSAWTATTLARMGGQAALTTLDGPSGWLNSFGASADAAGSVRDLGSGKWLLSVAHKAAPACFFVQTLAQAALKAAQLRPVIPESVSLVEIGTYRAAVHYPGCDRNTGVNSVQSARMSLPFGVVATLVYGNTRFENWIAFHDSRVQQLLAKTQLIEDESLTSAYPGKQGGFVRVRFIDGFVAEARQEDYEPVAEDELFARLTNAAERAFDFHRARDLHDMCRNLASVRTAAELVRRLRA